MNELMEKKLKGENSNLHEIVMEIVAKTKMIKDCLVFDQKGVLDEKRIDFEKVLALFGDETGYEVSCNEIRIDKVKLLINQIIPFLFEFGEELTKKFSRRIVIYIQMLDDSMELRFHSFRGEETLWLSEDLNVYDIPIICYITEMH